MSDQIETAPVRAGDELNWPALEAWLRARIDDLPEDAMQVVQFPRGTANLTYRLAFGSRQLVLRRPPFGKIAPGAHDMAREYAILSRLWQAWACAPRAYAMCEDAGVIGAPFVVQEYRDGGLVIFGEAPPSMAGLPDLGTRLARALADCLADLHKVDYAACGLSDLGKPDGFVERQVAGWRDRWARVASAEAAERYDRMGTRLAEEMPQSGPPAIVHNDFKLDNCQFLPGQPDTVVSVFDWDMATLGDPLVDVLHDRGGAAGVLSNADHRGPGVGQVLLEPGDGHPLAEEQSPQGVDVSCACGERRLGSDLAEVLGFVAH